jgi:alanine racemase
VSHAAIRPTRVEIDVGAIVANAGAVADRAGVDVYAVVKADAYGHGAVAVARALAAAPRVAGLAVATVEEGIELRDAGVAAALLVMGPALGGAHAEMVARAMTPMVSSAADLARFAAIGRERGAPVAVHLKLDTGMGRLGLAPADAVALAATPGIRVEGACTHLACADTDDPFDPESMTARQLARFAEARRALAAAGIGPLVAHAANSAGALLFPAAACDRVRPGLALYGNGVRPAGVTLRPVVTLASEIAQLRPVPAGGTVSYGARWTAARDARVAVVPLGYADGYPRNLTGSAEVLVRGRRCPVAGTVCMDMISVDVTALGEAVRVGDPVVLLGAQGSARIGVAEFAAWAGISEYEVTCGISKRVPRVHI